MDKIHAFRESPEPSPGFPGFSWKNIPVFPRKPGISMLSVKKSREKPRKPGSPGFSGVFALFLAPFYRGSDKAYGNISYNEQNYWEARCFNRRKWWNPALQLQ